jgi:hypothetical protein
MARFLVSRVGTCLRSGIGALGLAGLLAMPAGAAAPSGPPPAIKQIANITWDGVPPASGPAFSFDISWVGADGTYYLADRTMKGIDIIDSQNHYLKTIGGFVGLKLKNGKTDNDHSGPNGVVVIDSLKQAWAGDGDSTLKVVDLAGGQVINSLKTGGKARADELAYDSLDKIILIANDADDPPFVSFASATSQTILGNIQYPDATNGIEQPVWDPNTDLFYLAIPQTKQNPGGQIDAIDPVKMTVVNTFPVSNCVPHGLALGPNEQLLLGCSGDAINLLGAPAQSQIMDPHTGSILAVVMGIGGSDEVWYNPGDNRYYLAASSMTSDGTKNGKPAPVLGVIDAGTYAFLGSVPTVAGAHSVAADPQSERIFAPNAKGVAVYQSPGLARGQAVTGVLNGQASGTFNTYFFTGNGQPASVNVTFDASAKAGGLTLQVSGPTGVVAFANGTSLGKTTFGTPGAALPTAPTAPSLDAVVFTVDGAQYAIQVGNYTPGTSVSYTLTVS